MKKVKIGPTLACADLMNVERDIKILDSIGVLYGYGDYEELSKAGANYIAKEVIEILGLEGL